MGWGLRTVALLLALSLLSGASALEACGPEYNFARAHQYKAFTLTEDLHCPAGPAAIWIWDADGLVLDCDGHTISGNRMPVLRVSETQNLTLIDCELRPDEGFPAIEYTEGSSEEDVTILEEGDPAALLRPAPHDRHVTAPESAHPIARLTANTTRAAAEAPATDARPPDTPTGAERPGEETPPPGLPWLPLAGGLLALLVVIGVRSTKRAGRSKRRRRR